MASDNLDKIKARVMEPYWTENMHHELEELPGEDAKRIVDSMSEGEIFQKVNHRKFQEDYIADYIEYLWDVSEEAYWKHIKVSLCSSEDIGLLWSDNMSHLEKMCNVEIPKDVFQAVLAFVLESTKKQDLDALSDVIKAQVNIFSRFDEIEIFSNDIREELKESFLKKINSMLNAKSIYEFL